MASDDDIITLEHTLALYRGIPNAELAIVPGTSHFLTQEKPDLFAAIVADFIGADPVVPIAPVRRAQRL
jgi:pimeloyl-ACP methyl ester carboxylesterase